jgi:hypothetical protein
MLSTDPASNKTSTNGRPPRPTALRVIADNIPQALRELLRWVLWRYEWNGTKWTKVPYQPNGCKASSTDPTTWSSYETVLAAYQAGGWDGIGIVLGAIEGVDLTLAGVDYDDCLDGNGRPNDLAARGTRKLNTYAEVSPSGRGIKQLCWGTLRKNHGKRDGDPAEAYHSGRYFTITGHAVPGTPGEIADRSTELLDLEAELWPTWTFTATGERDDRAVAREALAHLNTSRAAGYWDWLAVGMALHSVADDLLADWDLWSRSCPEKYREGVCAEKWATLTRDGGLTLGSLIHWAKQDSGWTPGGSSRRRTTRTAAGGCEAPGATDRPLPQDVIGRHWQDLYAFAFRRGDVAYSDALGREVKRCELLGGAPTRLIEALKAAAGAPQDDATSKMPAFFKKWAPTAWADLMDGLQDEPEAEAEAAPAAEEFRRRVAALMFRLVTLSRVVTDQKGQAVDQIKEARSVIDWCQKLAKPGQWESIRSYRVWCRRTAEGEGDKLAVAIRAELAGQVGDAALKDMPHRQLATLAVKYGVAVAGECRPGGNRAIELTPEFIAALLAKPAPVYDAHTRGFAFTAHGDYDADADFPREVSREETASERHDGG